MSSMALARPAIRQSGNVSRMAARRFESNTTQAKATEAAKAAKESAAKASAKASASASEYAAKAQQGLSRVSSAAGPAITGAAKGLANSLGKVGGRTGKVVGFAERQIPQVLYWGRVGSELAKIVFRNQKMTPPSMQTVQSYYQSILKTARNPSALAQTTSKASQQPATMLQQLRNVNSAQLIAGGVVAAECLGFFTVGEMIGRFKIIGYHGEHVAEHH
ncbi:F-type H+-transporting ATPase subunit G [Apiospora saccharicola]|uniref:F-type H+-transporting ATPase subunit G n=1 Tax=Apiospora saccharicola TaxID=335842 RepID=A0ABR1VMP8_9PEZI